MLPSVQVNSRHYEIRHLNLNGSLLGPGSGRAKRPSPATRWEQAREDYIGILIGVSADGIQIVDVDKVMKDV